MAHENIWCVDHPVLGNDFRCPSTPACTRCPLLVRQLHVRRPRSLSIFTRLFPAPPSVPDPGSMFTQSSPNSQQNTTHQPAPNTTLQTPSTIASALHPRATPNNPVHRGSGVFRLPLWTLVALGSLGVGRRLVWREPLSPSASAPRLAPAGTRRGRTALSPPLFGTGGTPRPPR